MLETAFQIASCRPSTIATCGIQSEGELFKTSSRTLFIRCLLVTYCKTLDSYLHCLLTHVVRYLIKVTISAYCCRNFPTSRIPVRSNFFAERVINAWNGLPADRIDFSSYPKFQSSLQHCV